MELVITLFKLSIGHISNSQKRNIIHTGINPRFYTKPEDSMAKGQHKRWHREKSSQYRNCYRNIITDNIQCT